MYIYIYVFIIYVCAYIQRHGYVWSKYRSVHADVSVCITGVWECVSVLLCVRTCAASNFLHLPHDQVALEKTGHHSTLLRETAELPVAAPATLNTTAPTPLPRVWWGFLLSWLVSEVFSHTES